MTLPPERWRAALAAAALLLASPAWAQLVPLPALPTVPTGPLVGGGVGAVRDDVRRAVRLVDRRAAVAAALIRDHPRQIDVDGAGAAVVRSQVLAVAPSDAALAAARSAGFDIGPPQRLDAVDMTLVILTAPRGLTTRAALARLRKLDPEGAYDFNHLYLGSGAALDERGDYATLGAPVRADLGLIDGGVAAGHSAFAGAHIEQRGFAPGAPSAGAHGTAVASLMVGRDRGFSGAAPGRALKVADVYGTGPTGGSAAAIVQALAWMSSEGVRVVNVSLVGPPNAVLAAGVRGAQAHGVTIVAAVGNDGPAAAPLYPAAYRGVVSVTGVDARGKVLPEAGRAGHVDFAAPGVGRAAQPRGGYGPVRGTSFSAPIVAGLLAQAGSPDALARQAADAGAPGTDPVYGRGVVGAGVGAAR